MADTTEQLSALLAQVVARFGLDLESVDMRRVGNRVQLRVAVDRDGGVDLDSIADVSRVISQELDENPTLLPRSPYVLEVGSPGVDRPLTLPRHWRRAKGRLVKVTVADESFTGRLLRSDDQGADLIRDGDSVRVEYVDVRRAVVQVELSAPKEGD